ncbi:hypothetical protein FKP32DRAFT_1168432 [Trametes sanguinea]|nr:hypothetical protein FKP32DRAFT_1168432 [Trametes sanguinea]
MTNGSTPSASWHPLTSMLLCRRKGLPPSPSSHPPPASSPPPWALQLIARRSPDAPRCSAAEFLPTLANASLADGPGDDWTGRAARSRSLHILTSEAANLRVYSPVRLCCFRDRTARYEPSPVRRDHCSARSFAPLAPANPPSRASRSLSERTALELPDTLWC